jgi:hypothetical protein
MPGPYSSDHGVGSDGPPHTDTPPGEPIPATPGFPPQPPAAAYPAQIPPPAPFPGPRRRRRLLVAVGVAVLVIAAAIAGIVYTSHRTPAAAPGAFSDTTATTAIQGYLDALQHRDTEAIARNTLCGIYDAVRDRRSDQALAKLSSDAFRKQFSEAQVTSIDKIVYWSNYQAQVLFTMRVQPSTGTGTRSEVQGVAQLISQHNQILVCSYVLHSAGVY